MAREKQEQEEARRKLEVSKIQIPLEQPGFNGMLGEKGISEKRCFPSFQLGFKAQCVFVPLLWLCVTPAWPFPPALLPFGSPRFPLGTEELMRGELCGPPKVMHIQEV